MIKLPTPPLWTLLYHEADLGSGVQGARDFTADNSNFTLAGGATLRVENETAGGDFEFQAGGLYIEGGAGLNVGAATRNAPLALIQLPDLGFDAAYQGLAVACDMVIVDPTNSTGAALLFEVTDQQESSRTYVGNVGGTDRVSSQATFGGTQTTVDTYDPVGGHPATIRLVQFAIWGGDWDFHGNGASEPWPGAPGEIVAGNSGLTAVTDRPFAWNRSGNFDPSASSAHLVFAPVGDATLLIRRLAVWKLDVTRLLR